MIITVRYCGILCTVRYVSLELRHVGWMDGWVERRLGNETWKEALLPIFELICAYQWMDFRGKWWGGRKCMGTRVLLT